MRKEIYILSGLGADERVFQNLDFSDYKITFIKWITPKSNETIENYVVRLRDQIVTNNPILIGLSFGGIIAIELAKQIETEKVIILASVKSRNEIPFYYRILGKIEIHKLIPTSILKISNVFTNWFFGISSRNDKKLLKNILNETDSTLLKWSIDKIVKWENQVELNNLIQIHGSKDRIFPVRFIKCNLIIRNGGHLMTLNKSDELNIILKQQI